MKIPVHDDHHGTAIISRAALVNALELVGKEIGEVKVVVNGTGASGIACAEHYICLGVKRENISMVDTKGVIYKGCTAGMNAYGNQQPTLEETCKDAEVLMGLSVKGAFTPEIIASLAAKPIVFAMANPDPEITYGQCPHFSRLAVLQHRCSFAAAVRSGGDSGSHPFRPEEPRASVEAWR